jgi:hypothetical protein
VSVVSVVLLVAAAVIGVGLIVVAAGRGGEMTEFSPDLAPHETDVATAADVALLRLPVAPVVLGGYHRPYTDEVLNLVARAVTERDVEIAMLRRQIAHLQSAQDARSAGPADPAAHLDAIWEPRGFPGADADAGPDDAPPASPSPFTGAVAPLGQPDPGSPVAPLVRREASPAPPPAETQPWSAWEPSTPAERLDADDPADPEQTG